MPSARDTPRGVTPRITLRRCLRAIACAIPLAVCTKSHASSTDHQAAAQALFDDARKLVAQHRFSEACPKFAQSLRLDSGLGTMLWLADCLEKNGQHASAWAVFKDAAALAALNKDSRESLARMRSEGLEPRLAKLVINVAQAPTASSASALASSARTEVLILRDHTPVSKVELGIAIPVDPGPHEITASAPGYQSWSQRIEVPPIAGTVHVIVPELTRAPASEQAEVASATRAPDDQAQGAHDATPSKSESTPAPEPSLHEMHNTNTTTQTMLAWSALGLGVAAIGAGGYFGLKAKATYDESNAGNHCAANNTCDAAGVDLRRNAQNLAAYSTIAFGAGAALAASGVVLWLTRPKDASLSARVVPVVSASGAGIVATQSF